MKQWPNGNDAGRGVFGRRFEPRSTKYIAAAVENTVETGTRAADLYCYGLLRYHSTSYGVTALGFPTAWSLLSKNF